MGDGGSRGKWAAGNIHVSNALHGFHPPAINSGKPPQHHRFAELKISQGRALIHTKAATMLKSRLHSVWPPFLRPRVSSRLNHPIRQTSTKPSPSTRIDRLTAKLPRRLQKYTSRLRDAPVSHVVSFLLLHEITAIVPLFALFGVFHYTDWVPVGWMTDHFGDYVQKGVARFERYFARKGWFGFTREDYEGMGGKDRSGSEEQTEDAVARWRSGELKYRILVEVALAYAVTKALLPLRIIASVSATPWFAGILVRTRQAFSRKP